MVLVFKTNIEEKQEKQIRRVLSDFKEIERINFDFEDCDNILRIESTSNISAKIINTVTKNNNFIEELH